ncbi:MAG: PDZ domain-containing protein [Deltaproteobacteria bacterium]|nr:PDZ domain-containing protein [Deltaproteobacteria bacterium]
MNTLSKKHFWVVKLAGTALLALVVAGAVSDFIAGELFALPAATWSQPRAGPGDGAPMAGELGRVPASEQALQELGDRRIFRLDDPVPVVAVVVPQAPGVDPAGAPTSSGELTESQLPINLMGTFVSAVPDYSYATLQIGGEAKVAALGSEYLEGKAKVVKIARGHVVLREDASYTYLKLWADKTAQPAPGGPVGKPVPAPGDNPPPIDYSMAKPNEGITKTGAYTYTLDRKMLDKQLADISKLQQDARPTPHYQDNQYQGIKLASVRPGSLFRAIGLRTGDIVKSVNGTAIDSPTKALELFEQLKSSSNIAVEIERRGKPNTLSYSIQ